ncbi:MAG: flagellar basal body P-ring formation chaperone FlgA [Pseudomonadota bacterium]
MILFSRHIQSLVCLMTVFLFINTQTVFASEDSTQGQKVSITVEETGFVNTDEVYLGQIATIEAMGLIKEALEKVSLGHSPKPDKIKAFDKAKIIAAIQSQRYLPENITIQAPDRIYVKRLSQKVSKEDVRQFVNQSLARYFPGREFNITAFNVLGLSVYPQGEIRFRADPADMVDSKGRLSFFMDLLVDGNKVDRVSVKGSVSMYEDIVHVSRPVQKGQPILGQDLYVERKNIFDLDSDYIVDVKKIDQKISKSDLKKGDYLTQSLLAEPFLVKKGDVVTLVAKNANLLILTTGICKEDGFENTLVRVENLNSGELVRGIVTDKSRVEVVH